MTGWGITGRLAWWRRGKRRTAERLVTALNDRKYDDLVGIVTEDLLYLDTMSNALRGREAFISANLRMRKDAPDMAIVLDDFSEVGDTLLVRGRTISAVREYCSDSLWHVKFAGGRINELQAFRDHNAISLPAIAARAED